MPGSDQQTILQRLGTWAATLQLEDIPDRVVEKTRLQVISCCTAAALSPWHEAAQAVLRARRSKGDSLVFATGDRLAPADAAFVNAAFAMSLDFDDYFLCGHPGHSAVLVPLAHAETLDEVLVAAVAANEVMGRLSTACLVGPLNGQMTSYIHNAGAAVSLGRLLGLSAQQMVFAMAIALYQPNFCLTPGFWDEGSKTITASTALDQGMQAARLAKEGLTGPADLIEHPAGFLSVFAFARFPGVFDGLGKVWFSDTLCYKRYPGTSYISAAVEGALEATAGRSVSPEEVESVRVETTLFSSTIDSLGAAAIERSPMDANAVNFSVRLSVAAAMVFGDLTPAHMRPERLAEREEEIRALARKVKVEHDWALSLRLLGSSPVGLRMFARLSPDELVRVIVHGRKMNRVSGAEGRNEGRFRTLLGDVSGHLKRLAGAFAGPVTALDLEAESFKMYQSSRTTVDAGGVTRSVMVDIPVGACGRDREETRGVVAWRNEQAFGDRGEELWRLVFAEGTSVAELTATAAPRS